jgi:hypothetical protein
VYHEVWRQTQITFDENEKPDGNGMANWGKVLWATDQVPNLTSQSGADSVVRGAFMSNGVLQGTNDTNFRPINQNWPVFGFAIDLGKVETKQTSTLFTIGLLQNPAVQFLGAQGVKSIPALWTSYFNNEAAAVSQKATLRGIHADKWGKGDILPQGLLASYPAVKGFGC